jgi:hypothetical protein
MSRKYEREKYEPGKLITTIDELMWQKQEFVFHRKRIVSIGWISCWPVRYALKEIEKGNIRCAKRKPYICRYYAEEI